MKPDYFYNVKVNVRHPFPASLSSTLLQSCMDMRFEPLAHKKAASKCTQLSCVMHVWSGTILTFFVKPLSRCFHASHVSTAFLRWEKHFFFPTTQKTYIWIYFARSAESPVRGWDWGLGSITSSSLTGNMCKRGYIMDVYLHSAVCNTQDSVSCSSNYILCVDTVSGDLCSGWFSRGSFFRASKPATP